VAYREKNLDRAAALEKEYARVNTKRKRVQRVARQRGELYVGPMEALAAPGLVLFISDFLLRLSTDYIVIPPVFYFRDLETDIAYRCPAPLALCP